MGEVIKTRIQDNKIVYKIELTEEEALQLKNHAKNVHMFSAGLCENNTRIIERGNKKGAKYFVIPLNLKSRKKKKYSKISYQKVEASEKTFFVCVVEKDPLF